jgi:hypothetical protein
MNALGQLIGVLFVVGLIIRYFWWIAAVVAVVMTVKRAPRLWARHQEAVEALGGGTARDRRPGRPAACVVLGGDPRGTYGAEITPWPLCSLARTAMQCLSGSSTARRRSRSCANKLGCPTLLAQTPHTLTRPGA